jgi:hypothetical protein
MMSQMGRTEMRDTTGKKGMKVRTVRMTPQKTQRMTPSTNYPKSHTRKIRKTPLKKCSMRKVTSKK